MGVILEFSSVFFLLGDTHTLGRKMQEDQEFKGNLSQPGLCKIMPPNYIHTHTISQSTNQSINYTEVEERKNKALCTGPPTLQRNCHESQKHSKPNADLQLLHFTVQNPSSPTPLCPQREHVYCYLSFPLLLCFLVWLFKDDGLCDLPTHLNPPTTVRVPRFCAFTVLFVLEAGSQAAKAVLELAMYLRMT